MPKQDYMKDGFEPKIKVMPKCPSTCELTPEDITLIHKCLNTFISPSYLPLDDSVYDSFYYYLDLLYQSSCFELKETVISPLYEEYESFDEAYNGTMQRIDNFLKAAKTKVPDINFCKVSKFSNKQLCRKLYLQNKRSKYFSLQEVFKEGLESSKWTDISFLSPDELESWIDLMKQNLSLLKPSARNFTLKFIALISRNIKCFRVLVVHGVYDLLWSKYLYQDCRFRCLFVKILNSILSHREGRHYVTNLNTSDMWKRMLEVGFQSKEINFYYQEVLLDFLLNFTLVPHASPLNQGVIVARNFYKFVSFLSDESELQMNFVLKLLQRLLDGYTVDKIPPDDMSSIVRYIEKLFPTIPKKPDFNLICKYFQMRLYLDRLSMNYDNEIQTPLVDAHYEFIMKIVYNLESLLNVFVLHVHEYKLNREEGFNKWLEYVELCYVVYFSKTPPIEFIPPRCSDEMENYSPPLDAVDVCHVLIKKVMRLFLYPIWKGLEEHTLKNMVIDKKILSMRNSDRLFENELDDVLNADVSFSAAMKSFACFRRVFLLLEDTPPQCRPFYYYKVDDDLISIQVPLQRMSTCFTSLSPPMLDMVVEWIRTLEYYVSIPQELEMNLIHVSHLLQFEHEEKITQTLLGVMKMLLENVYRDSKSVEHMSAVLDVVEGTSSTLSSLLNSKSWIVRDTTLEVLHLEVKLNVVRSRRTSVTGEKSFHLAKTGSQFMKYVLLAQKDGEHFVRASAVDLIHTKLLALVDQDESGGLTVSDDVNVASIRNMVLDAMLRICCNEHESIVEQKALNCLLTFYLKPKETLSRVGDVVEVAKYYAIKHTQAETREIASKFFLSRLNQFFSKFKPKNASNHIEDENVTHVMNACIIDMKVILTILFYEEDERLVSWLCNQLISRVLSIDDGAIKNILDELSACCGEIRSIDDIIDLHGSLLIEKNVDLNDASCSISLSTNTDSSHTIGEIVNSNDVELLISNNKPKNRYFSLPSKKSPKDKTMFSEFHTKNTNFDKPLYSDVDATKFSKFHTKNTFFDELMYSDVDALCIFCNTMSRENLKAVVNRRFGVDFHRPRNFYHSLKSLFNDILMYDSNNTLQDIKDCY